MAISIFDSLGTGSAVGWVVHWTLGGFLLISCMVTRLDTTNEAAID